MKNKIQDIINKLYFIELCRSISRKEVTEKMSYREIRDINQKAIELLESMKQDEKMHNKSVVKNMEERISDIFEHYNRLFSPKISISLISKKYQKYIEKNDVGNLGIEYGWLVQFLDMKNISPPNSYWPYQTRIGVGHYSGTHRIQEKSFLEDGIFFYIKANDFYDEKFIPKVKSLGNHTILNVDDIEELNNMKRHISGYSSSCFVNLYNFLESYVNSVGYSYRLYNIDNLDSKSKIILEGKDTRGNFLSLEDKIKSFHKIIRNLDHPVFSLKDKSQLNYPFKEFIDVIKPFRDSIMHNNPSKLRAELGPAEWISVIRKSLEIILEVAKEFWRYCYPNRNLPAYLFEFDKDQLIDVLSPLNFNSN